MAPSSVSGSCAPDTATCWLKMKNGTPCTPISRGGIEPGFSGDGRQHVVVADRAPVDEIGVKQPLDQVACVAL